MSMAARKKYAQLAEVSAIGTPEPNYANMLGITFTNQDSAEVHFPLDNALVIKLTIARCYIKRILLIRAVRWMSYLSPL